jgi:UDP-N-acetylmuramyl tripeptide synthase
VLAKLSPETVVILNGDDPGLVALAEASPARKRYFGLDPGRYALTALPHAADASVCVHCGATLDYDALSLSHLGWWRCASCDWKRPTPDVEGKEIRLDGIDSLDLTIVADGDEPLPLHLTLPGFYNAYNAVAAIAAAFELGVTSETVRTVCAHFAAPFGRVERFTVDGRSITLALAKNPVGFNEMLRMIAGGPEGLELPLLIAINDNDADGRDVSWLWDVDFELLAAGCAPIGTTGIRGADMANRLKYAGVALDRIVPRPPDLRSGFYDFAQAVPPGQSGFVLATYTAMLGIRKVLADDGLATPYWEE